MCPHLRRVLPVPQSLFFESLKWREHQACAAPAWRGPGRAVVTAAPGALFLRRLLRLSPPRPTQVIRGLMESL